MSRDALHIILAAIVLSAITYALPSFAGQLSIGDKARLCSLFRKAFKRGFCCQTFSIDELISYILIATRIIVLLVAFCQLVINEWNMSRVTQETTNRRQSDLMTFTFDDLSF